MEYQFMCLCQIEFFKHMNINKINGRYLKDLNFDYITHLTQNTTIQFSFSIDIKYL